MKKHREGSVARAIEQQTAKLPSDAFLWAAGASITASLILKLVVRCLVNRFNHWEEQALCIFYAMDIQSDLKMAARAAGRGRLSRTIEPLAASDRSCPQGCGYGNDISQSREKHIASDFCKRPFIAFLIDDLGWPRSHLAKLEKLDGLYFTFALRPVRS
jgi:hypothetical protein